MEECEIEKRVLSWSDVEDLVARLVAQIPNAREYDAILCITRGGMMPAGLISEAMDIRNIMVAAVMSYTGPGQGARRPFFWQFPDNQLLHGKRILIVDDVWSDGRIAMAVKIRVIGAGGKPEVAVLHYRARQSEFPNDRPDYVAMETDEWVVYPWDRRE